MNLFKVFYKISLLLVEIALIYFVLIFYLNSSYNTYQVSSMLSRLFPGRFYIEDIKFDYNISSLLIKKGYLIAPKGEKVVSFKNLKVEFDRVDLFNSLIFNKKLSIKKIDIDNLIFNLIVDKDYINIAEMFINLKRKQHYDQLIFNDLFENKFLFSSDSEFFSMSTVSKDPFKIAINNATIKKGKFILSLPTLKIEVGNFTVKNGSFQLTKEGVISRGDLLAKDISVKSGDFVEKLDSLVIYGFEQSFKNIKLNYGRLKVKNSEFLISGVWKQSVLQDLDLVLSGKIVTADMVEILKKHNIILPEDVALSEDIILNNDIYGTLYYPLINSRIKIRKLFYQKFKFNTINIIGEYNQKESNLNLFMKDISYNQDRIERIKAIFDFDNIENINIERISFNQNRASFKFKGNFNILTGETLFKTDIKRFSTLSVKKYIPNDLFLKFKNYFSGILDLKIDTKAENIFKQKNIFSKVSLKYSLLKSSPFGKKISLKSGVNFNEMALYFKPTYIKFGRNGVNLRGYFNLKRLFSNIKFNIDLFSIEKILALLGIKEELKGDFNLNGYIKGDVLDPDFKARISLFNLKYLSYANSELFSDIQLKDGTFQLYGLNITNRDFSLFITTKVKLYKYSFKNMLPLPEFAVYIGLSNLKIGNILKNKEIDLQLKSEIEIYGTPKNITGGLYVKSENFSILGEKFDSFNFKLDFIDKKLSKTKTNIAKIDNLTLIKNGDKLLTAGGNFDFETFNFDLGLFFPRLKLNQFHLLKDKNKKSLIKGDIIGVGHLSGDLNKKDIKYNFAFRFESFKLPYQISETKQKVVKSKEFGKSDKIVFVDKIVNKLFNLGKGDIIIDGDQKSLTMKGDLFSLFKFKSEVEDIMVSPIFSIEFKTFKFPVHKFYSFPIKTVISLDTIFKYDILNKKPLLGKVVFTDFQLSMGKLKITEAERKWKKNSVCTSIRDGKKVRDNCIKLKNGRIILDFGFSFLNQNIFVGGTVSNIDNMKNFYKNGRIMVNMTGGIGLQSFKFFKDIFSDIDGKAFLVSRVWGTPENLKYRVDLGVSNTTIQPTGFNQNIVVDRAKLRFEENKLYLLQPIKGILFGGTFEIKGSEQNLLFDLDKRDLFVSFTGHNMRYNLPDTLDFEANLDLTIKGALNSLKLKGNAKIIDGKYYKSVNIVDQLLVDPLTEKSAVYEEGMDLSADPILKNISLDVAIINEGLTVSNDLMDDVAIKADIHLGGTLGNPLIEGTVQAEEGGLVKLLTHRFELRELEIQFNKSDLMLSKLTFEAESQIQDYMPLTGEFLDRRVTLKISGTLNSLEILIEGEGLDKLQTMRLLLTGQSGADTNSFGEDAANKITNQLIGVLLQNALGKITSDFQQQMDVMIQTNVDTDGNLSFSANKMIGKRITLTGVGEFEDSSFQKEVSLRMTIIDQLIIEALKAFEEGRTQLLLNYRLLLR